MTEINLQQPPHSTDAEQALIGAAMSRPDAALDIDVKAEAFYQRQHKAIWAAIRHLIDNRIPVDVVAIADTLKSSGTLPDAGGIDYLAQIAGVMHSAVNIKHYAEIVKGKAQQREICRLGHELAGIGFGEGETVEKLNNAQKLISEFSDGLTVGGSSEPVSLDQCIRETIEELQANWEREGGMLGLPTGFADIDKRTQGLRAGDMIVIAGRPSQGKTTIAMNIAENVALNGGFAFVFSLEMPRKALTTRMFASVGRVDHTRLQTGGLNDDELTRISAAATKLKGRNVWIDDDSSLTSTQLLPRARRIAHKLNRRIELVVVDYLQLLNDKGEGVDRVTTISRNLKNLARELECPVIVLSQLNRGVEQRPDKRPLMSDLRDSGSIEQDADIILMMYRDEYYDENTQHKGLAEVLCRKYRNGQIGTDILTSNLHMCRFDNSGIRHIERQPMATKKRGFSY